MELETPNGSNLSLVKHLRENHPDCFNTLADEIEAQEVQNVVEDPSHPIWKNYGKLQPELVQCLQCLEEIDLDGFGLFAMEDHLKAKHTTFEVQSGQGEMESHSKPAESQPYENEETDDFDVVVPKAKKRRKGGKPVQVEASKRTCSVCKKVFSNRQSMQYHLKVVHSGIRPFKCQECGVTFARKDSFLGHSHSKDKSSFLCAICGKTFGRKNIRDQHEKTHLHDRRHECSFCGRKFMTRQQKMNHERVHTGEKPFQCTECGRQFARQHQLSTHFRIHTGEKPYSCAHCPQKFRHISSKNNHKCDGKDYNNLVGETAVANVSAEDIANATIAWVSDTS